MLPYFSLQQLDLSASPSKPFTVTDSECLRTFQLMADLPQLADLTLKHWTFDLADTSQLRQVLRQCRNLRELKLDNSNEQRPKDMFESCDNSLLHAFVSCLPSLQCLSICYYTLSGRKMDEEVAQWLARCLHRHWRQWRTKVQVLLLNPTHGVN